MAIDTRKYDPIFIEILDKQHLSLNMLPVLKGQVMTESTFQPRSYRYEPAFFKGMVERDKYWADKDAAIVSASYGLAQILFTTAWAMGMKPSNWKTMKRHEFEALAERMYDPAVNLDLEIRLMDSLMKKVWQLDLPKKWPHLSALDIALARYNGGSRKRLPDGTTVDKNPDASGILDQQNYVDKVWRNCEDIKVKEAK